MGAHGLQQVLKDEIKRYVLSGTRRHTRAGQAHAGMDARGGDTVELQAGDEPWAALMIPHSGGDTQRDNRLIKPHTHTANTAKHTKGAKRTMSVYTPCALRFYTSSTARGRYTHSRQRGDATLTRGREGRERSSASALQHFERLLACHPSDLLAWFHSGRVF